MSFDEIRRANRARHEEWPGGHKIDLGFRGLELAGEAGELINLIKKQVRLDRGITGTMEQTEELFLALQAELADVMICIDLVAMTVGKRLVDTAPKRAAEGRDLVVLGNRLGASIGRVNDAIYVNHPGRIRSALEEATGTVILISFSLGIHLMSAVTYKFNAASAKHGLETRMST